MYDNMQVVGKSKKLEQYNYTVVAKSYISVLHITHAVYHSITSIHMASHMRRIPNVYVTLFISISEITRADTATLMQF